jgi:hypothetical protein
MIRRRKTRSNNGTGSTTPARCSFTLDLAAFCAGYRFFFSPIRWTSLEPAIVEAMTCVKANS